VKSERPYEFGISPDGTYVLARAFRQHYTLALAVGVTQDLNTLGDASRFKGCLLDLRGTTTATTTTEKHAPGPCG
jgi:hypothetical protein